MRSLHTTLPRLWLQRGPKVWPLLPLAWLYGALLGLRRLAFARGWLASGHPGLPVVVVGNVVAGGAGKTPTTLALVQHLRERGLQVGVVSRGYGRQDGGVREVRPDSLAHEVGDEPLLLARSALTVISRNRLDGARRRVLELNEEAIAALASHGWERGPLADLAAWLLGRSH